jgi:hypothetical protein
MVGEPSWDGLDGPGQYLDGRTAEAKRFSFVVEADILKTETKADWSGFKESEKTTAVRKAVHSFITDELRGLMADDRRSLKKAAIEQNRGLIEQLPPVSRRQVGRFIDEVQEKCPSLTSKELSRTIEILGKLEQSRSGYGLLRQLVSCSPQDLDTWNSLMQRWTATNAEIVLGELERRLTVLKELQELIRDRSADELHELQPLFERGLWMFGPEYEAVDFTSNVSMNTVVREFFGKQGVAASRSRPDFVVLPDSSIGFYAADEFVNGEVSGIRKILIVELKRGGFCVTQKEADQAREYAKELRAKGCAQATTDIEAYAPSETEYWMHGHSTERDFIYVTTQTLTREQLSKLSDEVGDNRSLLVCCSAFRAKDLTQFPNMTVKKIPKMVLNRCEWGRDDYSLEIRDLPSSPPEPLTEHEHHHHGKRKNGNGSMDLFAAVSEGDQ